ncbi:N-acetyltransferase [Parashewanella curva]|uniref:N-acetyltransferase n=1 Tax=Parashewanella curva TaxID=2338552 RepID=A0A3L8PZT1_9GAMM|nr:GNAT family N-acetyltransferase [Parashewanella curva]RLV60043.1 N-acetyltransferase [Parashewanella curva]
MTKIITETPRLIIREFCLSDAADVFEFNSNADVIRFVPDDQMRSIEDAEQVIKDIWLTEYKSNGYARWAVEYKATGKVIGFCGFKFETHPAVQANDIGYRLLPEYWGKGLATEAGKACIDYAKHHLQFKEVLGDVDVQNTGSSIVLQKLGFEFQTQVNHDGVLHNRYLLTL